MRRKYKTMRVPFEFNDFLEDLRINFEQSTGEAYTKTQVLRKMGNKLKNRLTVRNSDFDWRIF